MWAKALQAALVAAWTASVVANNNGPEPPGIVANSGGLTPRKGGRCERYNGTACQGMGASFVWVFNGTTQRQQEARIHDGLANVAVAAEGFGDQHRCAKLWRESMCAAALPPCVIESFGRPFEAPVRLCKEICDLMTQTCGDDLSSLRDKNEAAARFIPRCSDKVGDANRANTFFYPNFDELWLNSPVFVSGPSLHELEDGDQYTTASESQQEPGGPVELPCWGGHFVDRFGLEEREFWDAYASNEDAFKSKCEGAGGEFATRKDPNGDEFFECVVKTRSACVGLGGDWVSVEQSDGKVSFKCFFPLADDSIYDAPASEAWATPDVVREAGVIEVGGGVLLLPVPIVLRCEEGGEVVLSRQVDPSCSSASLAECLPAPTLENVRKGLAELLPNGKRISLVQSGHHVMRLRVVGRGRSPSAEVVFEFDTVRETSNTELYLPPKDSDMVYIRSKIQFTVGDPTRFDTYLFRMAVMEALNEDLAELGLEIQHVIVLEVKSDGVAFEIRVSTANQPRVEARLRDSLFAFPLGEALFNYGLVNATDSCAAASQVRVSTDGFETLSALAGGVSLGVIAGALGGVALVGFVAAVLIRSKMRRLEKQESELMSKQKDVDQKEQGLAAKEDDLSKREKELADKLSKLEQQEQDLLIEKDELSKEQQELEMEALVAEQEFANAVKEELRDVDPVAAALLEEEERAEDEEVLAEGKSRLEALKEKFRDVRAPHSVGEFESCLQGGALDFLLRAPKRPVSAASGTVADRLKAFGARLPSVAETEEFALFVDSLVASGALRDVSEDPKEALFQEYEEAMYTLRSELHAKKKSQAAKLAERRKRRVNLVVEDAAEAPVTSEDAEGGAAAGEGGADPVVSEALVKEIEQELSEAFEREKARVKAMAPSQEDFEAAMAELDNKLADRKKQQLASISRRREDVRRKRTEHQARIAKELEAAEAKQREIALKVSSVFKRISSVDSKVKKLKSEHEQAQAQLDQQKRAERDRQRQKLAERKRTKTGKSAASSSKVAPDPAG